MQLYKKATIISAISALLAPQLSYALATVPEDQGGSYNMTLWGMIGLIVILLFVIGVMAHTLSQLTEVVRDKNRKLKNPAGKILKTLLLLLFVGSSTSAFAEAKPDPFDNNIPDYISGIPSGDFYLLVSIIALELLVIFALSVFTKILLRIIRNVEDVDVETQAKAVPSSNWFWDKFNSAASIEKEKDILLDHNYDGIRELDNSLPPWWIYGFYVTIIVGVIYIYRYHVSHDGMSQTDEYFAEMQQGEEDKAAYLANSANNVDESTVTLLTTPADIASGKEVYTKNCVACHLADGGGSVGPNLTDDYWLHGGSLKDVFKSIKYGWQDKGMKSWKDDLSPKQIQELTSFIRTLKGTKPAAPKEPQGELYLEAQPQTKTDSTKDEKVVVQ
jgi:cytochrome c oxidase cbb3-type subunit III